MNMILFAMLPSRLICSAQYAINKPFEKGKCRFLEQEETAYCIPTVYNVGTHKVTYKLCLFIHLFGNAVR